VPAKSFFCTLFATLFHFILLVKLNDPLHLHFVLECHMCLILHVRWLTFQLCNLVVAFFLEVALSANRAKVWLFFLG